MTCNTKEPVEGVDSIKHETKRIGSIGRCRGLEFDQVSALVLSNGHMNNRVLVSWSIKPNVQNMSAVKFFVYRGESPLDLAPLDRLGISGQDSLFEFVDHTANLLDLQKTYVYQVRAIEYDTSGNIRQEFHSWTFEVSGVEDKVSLYIISEHTFLYRHTAAGIPVFIFKKRMDGITCPECWDEVLLRSTKSNCLSCAGTGKLQGYYTPIEGWMSISYAPVDSSVQQTGTTQTAQARFDFTNYPIVRPGDIIVEAKTNNFWRIMPPVQFPHRNGVLFLQNGFAKVINKSDVEYKAITVPEDRRKILVRQLDERISMDSL